MTSTLPEKSASGRPSVDPFTEDTPLYRFSRTESGRYARSRQEKMTPGYMGTFTGARRYVLHTFASTQSALMRKRVSRFMEGKLCPVCHGKRLKSESLSVTFAGVDIGEFMQMPLDQLAELLLPISRGFQCPPRRRRCRQGYHPSGSDRACCIRKSGPFR